MDATDELAGTAFVEIYHQGIAYDALGFSYILTNYLEIWVIILNQLYDKRTLYLGIVWLLNSNLYIEQKNANLVNINLKIKPISYVYAPFQRETLRRVIIVIS